MAVFETWLKSDLKKPLTVKPLAGNLFSADNQGNLIGVEVMDGGSPAELSGGVTGYVIRADGATLPISGTLAGNRASIVLPASAYAVIGHVSIVIKVGTTTVGACTSYVYQTTTDTVVDPGRVIPSIEELLAQIDACIAATAGANAAAASANTAAANANAKAELADTAAENANTKAGLANTAASAANAAAGKIDNMTVAATTSPEGSQASVTITEVNGHKHVAFGIPKGDKGKDFHIAFTFASIAAMEAYSGDIELFDYAMIDTGNVQDVDTGKLYCYEQDEEWHYIGDLSGAQGIKGETGTGIDHVTLNADYTLTIYYDDGTSDTTASIRGATGITPNISIGSVTTLSPNQQAYVERDQSSTPEAPVFNIGIPKGETGSVENVYGTTVPMSESDSTSVYNAINRKLDKNQGAQYAGWHLEIDNSGNLVPAPYAPFMGADGTLPGQKGLVPAPAAADNLKFLKGDGTWAAVPQQDISGKADKVSGATYGDLAKLDSQGNLVDSGIASENVVVKADIASKEWAPETGDTLLSFINSNCNFDVLPFSFAKTGSAVPADTPTEIAGSMFTGICIGHDGYITVKIQAFSTTATQYTFERDYYQGTWRTNWASIGAALQADVNSTQDGVAIVAVGDTHDAISSGQFVFVRSHPTLAKGMYKATAAIAANGALSTSNLTEDGSGGLNDLQAQVTSLNSKIASLIKTANFQITTGNTLYDGRYYGDGNLSVNGTIIGAYLDGSGTNKFATIGYINANGNTRIWSITANTTAYIVIVYI